MNLSEIRAQFVRDSGRYDLILPNGEDNGANFYIQAAVDYLDRSCENTYSIKHLFRSIGRGSFSILSNRRLRSIEEVFLRDQEGVRVPLSIMDYSPFLAKYRYVVEDEAYYGKPIEFTIASTVQLDDSTGRNDFGHFLEVAELSGAPFDGILMGPPSDDDYVVELVGLFYSRKLQEEADTNQWATKHPELLVLATQRMIEGLQYKSGSGVQLYDQLILPELDKIDKDHHSSRIKYKRKIKD